ncbi:hypothetical protein [Lichenicola sp.]|uniref:hypothetical protein n=1 Tax=Lichenicola sp. TaxID=2804529 RepID=UPI003AFFCA21
MSVLWCQGMFASGSTWLYNVARAVARELDPHGVIDERFVFQLRDTEGLSARGVRHIVKAHQAVGGVEAVAAASDAILVTLRDPRDAVVSLMQYQNFSFSQALFNVRRAAEACVLLGRLPQAVTLHYELGFIDDIRTIDGVAGHMGGVLRPEARNAIFQANRRQAVERFIGQLDRQPTTIVDARGDIYDLRSHWHRHHAGRTGEIGRWRRLLYPAQVHGIETALGAWMDLFGYQLSDRSLDMTTLSRTPGP